MEWVGFVLGEFGLRKSLDSWPIIFLRKCRRGSFLAGEDSEAQILAQSYRLPATLGTFSLYKK